jgi:SAM-dependent methyltransferase
MMGALREAWLALNSTLNMNPDLKPVDQAGAETLGIMAQASRYNRWQYEQIARFCGRRICEIGSGIGNMAQLLVNRSTERLLLTDPDQAYLALLEERFAGDPRVGVAHLKLPDFQSAQRMRNHGFDTVVALNVLEHIEDDLAALKCIATLSGRGGRVIILVPAIPSLHNSLDVALGHWRRYSPQALRGLFEASAIDLERLFYFNAAGILGWWLNGSLLGASRIPSRQLRLFDLLVPIWQLERLVHLPIGQSLIAIGRVE